MQAVPNFTTNALANTRGFPVVNAPLRGEWRDYESSPGPDPGVHAAPSLAGRRELETAVSASARARHAMQVRVLGKILWRGGGGGGGGTCSVRILRRPYMAWPVRWPFRRRA